MSTRVARSLLAFGAAVCAVGLARSAAAQDLGDVPSTPDPGSSRPGVSQVTPYWESGAVRPFFAAAFEAGAIYARVNGMLGYGKPYQRWVGVEEYSSISSSNSTWYGGARVFLPFFDMRVGSRYTTSFSRHFLDHPTVREGGGEEDVYTQEAVDFEAGTRARYVVGEAEATGRFPFPGGTVSIVATGLYVIDVPEGKRIFEEHFRQVMEPPWLIRGRLGYAANVGPYDTMALGGAVDLTYNPGRDTYALRVGPTISVSLTHHLEALGSIMIVALDRDSIGLLGADLGQLGLRYRWATGDRWPEFP